MKVLSIYSRIPSVGKKTIALNLFLSQAKQLPSQRIFVVDYSTTEKLQYSLSKYEESQFSSMEFLINVSSDILVSEAVTVYENQENNSFLKILPSNGCIVPQTQDMKEKIDYRIKDLFFKDLIDILVFILPPNLDENSISTNAVLASEGIILVTSDKSPSLKLTKLILQKFFTFVNARISIVLNKYNPPLNPERFYDKINLYEDQLGHRIFYSIPWSQGLYNFKDDGVFLLEDPSSEIHEIFTDLATKYYTVETDTQIAEIDEDEESPIALFITEMDSGSTMFYYLFKSADKQEVKNPVLISAAMTGIARLVSETAGRRGDLRYIDNGNVKIVQRKGKNLVGILYCKAISFESIENTFLPVLNDFIKIFEEKYEKEIKEFSRSGLIDFPNAKTLVEETFESFIFKIDIIDPKLEKLVINYAINNNRVHDNPEEVFNDFLQTLELDQDLLKRISLEFTTQHNTRHEFLQNQMNINPYQQKLLDEPNLSKPLCWCTKPQIYIQVQPFDTLTLLSLPEDLRPTAQSMIISNELTAELASKLSDRTIETERKSLETLTKLGYITTKPRSIS